jgi:omega-6 fatty acid desaturase (delta-12 desaturase)
LPGPSTPLRFRRAAWSDFTLVAAFFLIWCGISWLVAGAEGLLFGFLLPFAVWNFLMAVTVYLQHTHPRIPWYGDREAYRGSSGQHELTLHVVTPRWYGWLSNEIMEHSAHHVHAKIPLYNLRRAQARLEELLGGELPQETASLRLLLDSLRRCQLYDFEAKAWCAFDGRVTARFFGAAGEGRQTVRSLAPTAILRAPGSRAPGGAAGPLLKGGRSAEKRRAS